MTFAHSWQTKTEKWARSIFRQSKNYRGGKKSTCLYGMQTLPCEKGIVKNASKHLTPKGDSRSILGRARNSGFAGQLFSLRRRTTHKRFEEAKKSSLKAIFFWLLTTRALLASSLHVGFGDVETSVRDSKSLRLFLIAYALFSIVSADKKPRGGRKQNSGEI